MRNARILTALSALMAAVIAGGSHYTVRRGDALSEIAARHQTNVATLARVNHLADPDLILAGQRLVIPSGGGSENAPVTHLVRAGETLTAIAARYGLSIKQLADANGITDPARIFAGTRLLLESRGSAPQPAGQRRIHLVRAGETLGEIAARYGTTAGAVAKANHLSDPDLVPAGAALSVPSRGAVCPVPGASFFNDWGFARSGGRFHEGNDLFASMGTPVQAVVAGRAERVKGDVGGLQVWLHGDDGNVYVGTHLSDFGASGRVAAGEVVGYVGDSGSARGSRPHLHFEILPKGGEPVNPYPMLRRACG